MGDGGNTDGDIGDMVPRVDDRRRPSSGVSTARHRIAQLVGLATVVLGVGLAVTSDPLVGVSIALGGLAVVMVGAAIGRDGSKHFGVAGILWGLCVSTMGAALIIWPTGGLIGALAAILGVAAIVGGVLVIAWGVSVIVWGDAAVEAERAGVGGATAIQSIRRARRRMTRMATRRSDGPTAEPGRN